MIQFLCGCKSHIIFPTSTDVLKTYDGIGQDAEGFMVCAIHRQRRRGWRTVPYTATTMPVKGMGDWTELEYERWLMFGTIPERQRIPMRGVNAKDIRDKRDPEFVYFQEAIGRTRPIGS